MYRVLGGKMEELAGMQYESAACVKSVWTHYGGGYLQLLTCQHPSIILLWIQQCMWSSVRTYRSMQHLQLPICQHAVLHIQYRTFTISDASGWCSNINFCYINKMSMKCFVCFFNDNSLNKCTCHVQVCILCRLDTWSVTIKTCALQNLCHKRVIGDVQNISVLPF